MKNKYDIDDTSYMTNNIKEDIKKSYVVNMSYMKVWRCREKAPSYVRGTHEESYFNLPSYLHILQQKNSDIIMLGVCPKSM